jgi:hypothetical protein
MYVHNKKGISNKKQGLNKEKRGSRERDERGEWRVCSQLGRGGDATYNVCPWR